MKKTFLASRVLANNGTVRGKSIQPMCIKRKSHPRNKGLSKITSTKGFAECLKARLCYLGQSLDVGAKKQACSQEGRAEGQMRGRERSRTVTVGFPPPPSGPCLKLQIIQLARGESLKIICTRVLFCQLLQPPLLLLLFSFLSFSLF